MSRIWEKRDFELIKYQHLALSSSRPSMNLLLTEYLYSNTVEAVRF